MDHSTKTINPNPRDTSSWLSKITFLYVLPIFKKGYRNNFTESDLYDPLNEDCSTKLGNRLEKYWNEQLKTKTPNLGKALLKTIWLDALKLTILASLIDLGLRMACPLLIGQLLQYFQMESQLSQRQAIYYAIAIIIFNFLLVLFLNNYMYFALHLGMKIRIACCSIIYKKALRINKRSLGNSSAAKAVNLIANDVSRFEQLPILAPFMWNAPLSTLIISYFLWNISSYAGVVGIFIIFSIVPIQIYAGHLSLKLRLKTAYKTDERVRFMEQILSGIQVIKMYAWEYPFANFINVARKKEVSIVRLNGFLRGIYMTFVIFTTRFANIICLCIMVLLGQPLEADKVFTIVLYYTIISMTITTMFVRGVAETGEALAAIKRIQTFLMLEEHSKTKTDNVLDNNDTNILTIRNGHVKLNSNENEILTNINLTVQRGQLIGIIGPVGSGKSTLLHYILGEVEVNYNSIHINGKVSYVAQTPWIFASSVRKNILFGLPYDKIKYSRVIDACALRQDFKLLPHGDMTMVGDRGASLSGGQKARINLARAVYREADIYLLDDPLSAVDTHVGKHIYEMCINGLLANKTRILVTHQLQYMKNVDHLVILRDGNIELQGTFNELIDSDLDYAQMLMEDENVADENMIAADQNQEFASNLHKRSRNASISTVSTISETINVELKQKRAEQSSKGAVNGNILIKYFKTGNSVFAICILLLLLLFTQALVSVCDYYISFWTNEEELRSIGRQLGKREPLFSQNTYMYIGLGIILFILVIAIIRSFLFFVLCAKSSLQLHEKMFMSVIRTKMRFFNVNPSGRILNRFFKDMGAVDELMPKSALDSVQNLLFLTGAVFVTIVVNAYLLIPIFFIAILFHYTKKVYLKSSKNLKRLEGITRSPVFSHINETLEGLTTIRAYNAQNLLENEFNSHQDLNTKAFFMFVCCTSAFGFCLDLFCFLFTASIILFFVLLSDSKLVTAGDVGLAITQTLGLLGRVQWGMRQTAEVENHLTSVERLIEYTKLEIEPNFESNKKILEQWPTAGSIQFINVYLKYADDEPFVLKDLNLSIECAEKIGIVGRTGAGKSSIIQALFRLALIEGKILIDNVDTKHVDLQQLRKKISVIPQDPVLFSGTLRKNLDPFEEYTDFELWTALEEVELKDVVNIGNTLESMVLDHGSNFSVGQKQLICLARAIIRNNKILILDEATANVDPQTDILIQKTIRQKFSDCTVLTIAHRLNTIMDSDKVLVIEAGQVIEFSHPHILCENKNSRFYDLVQETGPLMSENLCKIAKDAYCARNTIMTTYL